MRHAGARPHVIYVAWGFPPSRAGGVYRTLATANAFAEAGWDVTVVTVPTEVFADYTGVDASLLDRIDPRVRVERIPFAWPSLDPDITSYSWLRVRSPGVWRKIRSWRDQVPFPEVVYGPWRPVLEAAVERIHRQRPADLVVATANPNVAFTACAYLHERHGVPYVLDYRDAWLLDVFSGARLHSPRSRAARWERTLVAHAREVWFVNEPIRAWHAELYPERADSLHVVANGYDTDTAPEPTLQARDPSGSDASGVTFGYIGTVSAKVPLEQFLAGWSHGRERDPALARSRVELGGYLGFYRTPLPKLMDLVEAHSGEGVRYLGPVPKADVRATYQRFDALLLILGTGRYVTSGKVYEYTASALPVVSVHDPGNAASDVLRDYPLWFPARSLEPLDVAAALSAAARAAVEADPATRAACAQFAERYSRERQLSPRVHALFESVTGSSRQAEVNA